MIKKQFPLVPFVLFFAFVTTHAQSLLSPGEQPQLTLDPAGVVRVVYGDQEKIFYATSSDKGHTFSKPVVVAEVTDMHLGMTRGPQLASSKDYSIVTAMDKKGNIHCFRLTHKSGNWEKLSNVNDVEGSAPEGLMSISADDQNHFFAVWLDLRSDKHNNICFSSYKEGKWSTNRIVYKSPDSHVCECCKPSISVKENKVSVMFRNWVAGSRDLYLINSENGGQKFSDAQKIGNGTWPLNGCPMDGGGLSIDEKNETHTAWQRAGDIFYAQPGKPEVKIGEGRNVSLCGDIITWKKDTDLFMMRINGVEQKIAEGTTLKAIEFPDKSILAVWENADQIFYKKIKA